MERNYGMSENSQDVMTRDQIPEDMCWDLKNLYASEEAWEEDFKKLDALLERYQSYKGRLAESAQVLKEAFEAGDELEMLLERLAVYAHLKHDDKNDSPLCVVNFHFLNMFLLFCDN